MSLNMTADDDGGKVLEITTVADGGAGRDPTAGHGFNCPCGSRHLVSMGTASILVDYRDMDAHDDVTVKCPDCA